MKKLFTLIAAALIVFPAFALRQAEEPANVPQDTLRNKSRKSMLRAEPREIPAEQPQYAPANIHFQQRIPLKANKELRFLAFYINQAVASNFYAENDFLKGQIVGRLFGANTTTTSKTLASAYVEQRLIPYFIYSPKLFNGKATLRASFELDWTWGDTAYGTGGNFGGGFSADQVNLQTQNVMIELNPWKGWAISFGLMRVFDTPYNPYNVDLDRLTTTGYRLAYFGSDGSGISVRKDWDFSRVKVGFYKLYENYPQLKDDVSLFEATGEADAGRKWKLGGSVYYIPDRGNGAGGVSILGQGLNSLLAAYNGVYRFPFGSNPYKADIVWLGAFFSRNADGWLDPWTLSGFVNVNAGNARTLDHDTATWEKATDILGVGASLRGAYRYGQTRKDAVSLDVIYASGDDDGITDKKYSGVITGNQYGAPGAIFIGSGSYLLMPHGNVVNRFTPAVMDISNMGYGLTAVTLNASRDFIPNRLSAKIGGVAAFGNVAPKGGGNYMGTEINANVCYNLGPYMSIELHGAYLALGSFYDSSENAYGSAVNGGADGRPANPWTCFLVFKWLMF